MVDPGAALDVDQSNDVVAGSTFCDVSVEDLRIIVKIGKTGLLIVVLELGYSLLKITVGQRNADTCGEELELRLKII